VLIVLAGLPGVGKTTIARELARTLPAVHVRVDSIEQALRRTGLAVEEEGYVVAHAIAADNLRAGLTVVADCVNPWPVTRDARSPKTRASPCSKSRSCVPMRRSTGAASNRASPTFPVIACRHGRTSSRETIARGIAPGSSSTPAGRR
jgi:hypothetical protein